MNENWIAANIWYMDWKLQILRRDSELAILAQANYVMHLAQEWAGVKK